MNFSKDRNSILSQGKTTKSLWEEEDDKEKEEKDTGYHLCQQRLNEFDARKDEGRQEFVHEREDSRGVKMPERKDELIEPDDEIVNLDLDEPPPPEVVEYARRELGETDEVKCQSLQEFRDLIYGNYIEPKDA
ncbi:hypothetical protein KPH14_012306 [Odynerus spinipes]|uniref:Uncharacterized protein n=1 Tax=Odynerus spinipes TaxID=1348599 RepID=A0AAD9RHS4_9HYME|nr:hypothetical protein KPH14_012306 [Odynerus spinipes]